MGINVKNERVEAEIRLLADELGVGLTDAIFDAVMSRRTQLAEAAAAASQLEYERKVKAIREIQERIRPFLTPDMTSNCDDLYDDDGLPA